ncbi:MAG: biotin/lipoate A/B protein ligase family protein [Candidatus Bathyarchaeia archaeon]
MERWRLLKLKPHNAPMNMAVDEAILTAKMQGLAPNTLRLYCWKPSAVSIGKFQKVQDEVQMENCRRYGVDVVRRITGGGAVYHDAEGEITYSVVADKRELQTDNIGEIYRRIYAGIVEGLKILGVKADFHEGDAETSPNLTVNGKKISGSAQSHKKNAVLQHGTVLVDVDLEKMHVFLKNVKNEMTSVKAEVGRHISALEVTEAITEGFRKALNVKFESGELTAYERSLAEKLYKEKYATVDWNQKFT